MHLRPPLTALSATLLLGPAIALAHSWYDPDCCSDRDCSPVPCDEISDEADGYHWSGFVFARGKARPSQDRHCHVCIYPPTKAPLCIYIQQGS